MKAKLELGAELDFLSPGEYNRGLQNIAKLWTQYAEGLKHVRFPLLVGVVPASGELTLGSTSVSGPIVGPNTGYAWRVCRVSVFGLQSAETINIYWGEPSPTKYVGTLSGTGTEWDTSHGLLLRPNDNLTLQGTGLTVGETITVNGEAVQAPAEQIFKLIGG